MRFIILTSLGWLLTGLGGATPQLTFIEALYDGTGLEGASFVTVSPDGRHVYVAGERDSAIAVFRRDENTGLLSFVETQREHVAGVIGLNRVTAVTISSDGRHVYATSEVENAVVVFSRNQTTGTLRFVEALRHDIETTFGLKKPTGVAVNPNGKYVYVVSVDHDSITAFRRDEVTGKLSLPAYQPIGIIGANGPDGHFSVTVSPDGQYIYVTSFDDDMLVIFSQVQDTGKLKGEANKVNGQLGVDGLDGATSVAVSPDGNHIYVVSKWDKAIAVFSQDKIANQVSFVALYRDGQNGVDGLDRARAVTVSPDGKHLYVTTRGDHAVTVFSRDEITGALSPVELWENDQHGLGGAASVAISPEGRHLYVANQFSHGLTLFSRAGATGKLSLVEFERDRELGLDYASQMVVSPDGRHIYVTGNGDNAVVILSRNETTEKLSVVDLQKIPQNTFLNDNWTIAASPDGRHLYVVNKGDNEVAVFSRNAVTGKLSFIERHQVGQTLAAVLWSVAVSADNKYVYVMNGQERGIVVFGRDVSAGTLKFITRYQVGQNEVMGIQTITSAALSPDGRHIYVTVRGQDHGVAVFSWDETAETLSFVEFQKTKTIKMNESHLAFSPDGRSLYVAGESGLTLGLFSRDPASGKLSLVETYTDGRQGMKGLNHIRAITIHPNGRYAYTTSQVEGTLAVFSRDAVTGKLSFVEIHREGQNGVHGLDGAKSTAVSPDGKRVYVSSQIDDAVAIFATTGAVSNKLNGLYLPLVRKNPSLLPDLVVDNLTVAAGAVTVVIKNQGPGPVNDTFWVDLYINPTPPPAQSNQEWHKLSSEAGLVWGVTDLPLTAGRSMTLTLSSQALSPEQSSPLPVTIRPGSVIYAQVDSANRGVAAGGVVETDETNNIAGPILSTTEPGADGLSSSQAGPNKALPPRAGR